ncbi:MAG: HEAT repeat domain-containing protein [Methylococcales bacterium]
MCWGRSVILLLFPPWSRWLKKDPEWVRNEAADALVEIGSAAVPALVEALNDHTKEVREKAAEALGKIGNPTYPVLAKAAQSGNLNFWRVLYAKLPANAGWVRVLRTIPTYWLLSPMTWLWLMIIWGVLTHDRDWEWRLSGFGRLELLSLILALPIGWLFSWSVSAGFIALLVSLPIAWGVALPIPRRSKLDEDPIESVLMPFFLLSGALVWLTTPANNSLTISEQPTVWIGMAWFSGLISLVLAAFVDSTIGMRRGIVPSVLMGLAIGPVIFYPPNNSSPDYSGDYFLTTAGDSLVLIGAVLLTWLLLGVVSVVLSARFLPWLKLSKEATNWLCKRDYHRFRLGPGLPWPVRWSGRLFAVEEPRQHDNFAEYFVCRSCGRHEGFVTARRLIGIIGAIPSAVAPDEWNVSLFNPIARQTISADIDRLDLYPPPLGKTIDYDYTVNAVLNALSEDHHRIRPLKQIPVWIHGRPPLPENTRRMLADRFGSVKNVA